MNNTLTKVIKTSSIKYGNSTINFKVKKTERKKSIGLSIGKDLVVKVNAPKYVSQREIENLLVKKAPWIIRKIEYVRKHADLSDFENYYLGEKYELSSIDAPSRLLKKWFEDQTRNIINDLVDEIYPNFLPKLKKRPLIEFKKLKGKWGFCNSKGEITFNYDLIKTPVECIKYVVVHEMCHIQEMNHGPKFYELLDLNLPNWKSIKSEMNKFSYKTD